MDDFSNGTKTCEEGDLIRCNDLFNLYRDGITIYYTNIRSVFKNNLLLSTHVNSFDNLSSLILLSEAWIPVNTLYLPDGLGLPGYTCYFGNSSLNRAGGVLAYSREDLNVVVDNTLSLQACDYIFF